MKKLYLIGLIAFCLFISLGLKIYYRDTVTIEWDASAYTGDGVVTYEVYLFDVGSESSTLLCDTAGLEYTFDVAETVLPSTASNLNIGAVAGTTVAGVNDFKAATAGISTLSTADLDDMSTFNPASNVADTPYTYDDWAIRVGALIYGDANTTAGSTFTFKTANGTTVLQMDITTADRIRSS